MMSEVEVWTFALAAFGVLLGSLARRAAELEAMAEISWRLAGRKIAVDLMLLPALAAFSGAVILYFEFPWVMVLLLSVAFGVGGFATSALIIELLGTVLRTMANKIGAAK
jgi:hypothetical protein